MDFRGADTDHGHDKRDVSYAPQGVAPAGGDRKPGPCRHQSRRKLPVPVDQKTHSLLNVADLGGLHDSHVAARQDAGLSHGEHCPFAKVHFGDELSEKIFAQDQPFLSSAACPAFPIPSFLERQEG